MEKIPWSKEEVKLLEKLYVNPKVTREDLEKVFKGRSYEAILHKASRLKLKRPVGREIDFEYLEKLEKLIEE